MGDGEPFFFCDDAEAFQRLGRTLDRFIERGVERLAEIVRHGHIMPVELRINSSASCF